MNEIEYSSFRSVHGLNQSVASHATTVGLFIYCLCGYKMQVVCNFCIGEIFASSIDLLCDRTHVFSYSLVAV